MHTRIPTSPRDTPSWTARASPTSTSSTRCQSTKEGWLDPSSWDAGYAELRLSDNDETITYRDHVGQRPLPGCDATAWHVMEPEEIILQTGDHTLTYEPSDAEWQRGVDQFQKTLRTLWQDGCAQRDLKHLSPLYVVTPDSTNE